MPESRGVRACDPGEHPVLTVCDGVLMVRIIFAALFVMLAGVGYAASPFLAAWNLREAIKSGDTATIERKVIWSSVRSTLRSSIAANAQLLPEATEAGERVRPSMWQRVKAAFGQSMLDRFIEHYVTPEGLPKLFSYRKTWNGTIKRQRDDEDEGAFHERARAFYSRMVRADFLSLTRVEIEMIDKEQSQRRYVSVMELHGTEWKLLELRIIGGDSLAKAGGLRSARNMIRIN
jgi:Protein of unknown function (DUF2939)